MVTTKTMMPDVVAAAAASKIRSKSLTAPSSNDRLPVASPQARGRRNSADSADQDNKNSPNRFGESKSGFAVPSPSPSRRRSNQTSERRRSSPKKQPSPGTPSSRRSSEVNDELAKLDAQLNEVRKAKLPGRKRYKELRKPALPNLSRRKPSVSKSKQRATTPTFAARRSSAPLAVSRNKTTPWGRRPRRISRPAVASPTAERAETKQRQEDTQPREPSPKHKQSESEGKSGDRRSSTAEKGFAVAALALGDKTLRKRKSSRALRSPKSRESTTPLGSPVSSPRGRDRPPTGGPRSPVLSRKASGARSPLFKALEKRSLPDHPKSSAAAAAISPMHRPQTVPTGSVAQMNAPPAFGSKLLARALGFVPSSEKAKKGKSPRVSVRTSRLSQPRQFL